MIKSGALGTLQRAWGWQCSWAFTYNISTARVFSKEDILALPLPEWAEDLNQAAWC